MERTPEQNFNEAHNRYLTSTPEAVVGVPIPDELEALKLIHEQVSQITTLGGKFAGNNFDVTKLNEDDPLEAAKAAYMDVESTSAKIIKALQNEGADESELDEHNDEGYDARVLNDQYNSAGELYKDLIARGVGVVFRELMSGSVAKGTMESLLKHLYGDTAYREFDKVIVRSLALYNYLTGHKVSPAPRRDRPNLN